MIPEDQAVIEIAAQALTDFWLSEASHPFVSRAEEAAAIIAGLKAAGYRIVEFCGYGHGYCECAKPSGHPGQHRCRECGFTWPAS